MTRKLLIVDGNGAGAVRQKLESLFRDQGYEAESAASVDAAVARLRDGEADVVLVDGAGGKPSDASYLEEAARVRLPLREIEERYIDEVLRLTGGNKVRASQILGIDRKTLYRRAERRRALAEQTAI